MLSNYFKWFLVSIIREIISNNSYTLLSEKSSRQFLQTIITEIIPNNSYKLLPEKSFQKMLIHYDKDYKLCLKLSTENSCLFFSSNIIRQLTENNTYKCYSGNIMLNA